jgi:hypothetical protein
MHPYRIPGRVRQIAYLAILGLAATGAAVATAVGGPWLVPPAFAASYLAVYVLHEHRAWRWWRRWHGVPDWSGAWQSRDGVLHIRQTWTRMRIEVTWSDGVLHSRMAEWVAEATGIRLTVVLADAAGGCCCMDWCADASGQLASTDAPRLPARDRNTVWARSAASA